MAGDTITVSGQDLYVIETPLGADCSGLATLEGPAVVALRTTTEVPPVQVGPVTVGAGGVLAPTDLVLPVDLPPGSYTVVLVVADSAPGYEVTWTSATLDVIGAPTSTVAPTTTAPPPVLVAPDFTG